MKKLLSITLLIALVMTVVAPAFARQSLPLDPSGNLIPAVVPIPAKSQAPITGTKIFKKNASADEIASGVVDITGWKVIYIKPSADVDYYYNNDTTKTWTASEGEAEPIFVGQEEVLSVTITLGSATAKVQGM